MKLDLVTQSIVTPTAGEGHFSRGLHSTQEGKLQLWGLEPGVVTVMVIHSLGWQFEQRLCTRKMTMNCSGWS